MLGLRFGHQRGNEQGRRRGLWTAAQMTISKSPSPSVRQQMSDKQQPALDLGKSLFLNRGFSLVFWLFSSLSSSSSSWWKKRDGAQYRCHQGKGKNLVSTLQCHPQHSGQNTTKNQYSRRLSSNALCLVWVLTPPSVIDWDFLTKAYASLTVWHVSLLFLTHRVHNLNYIEQWLN